MLKPFRIRDLLHDDDDLYSASQADQDEALLSGYRDLSTNDVRDAVVQITPTEYDDTVTKNPAARLSYLDEDDGERITVGSSLELAQRLDEPVPQWLIKPAFPGRLLGGPAAAGEPESMHLFDIRRSSDVVKTWRDIHAQTLSRLNFPGNIGSTAPSNEIQDATVVSNGSETSDARERWFQHCNPPRLSTASSRSRTMSGSGEIVDAPEVDLPSSGDNASVGDDSTNYLTKEGLRQAQEAGEKLRNSRNLLSGSQHSSFVLPSPSQRSSSHPRASFSFERFDDGHSKSPFSNIWEEPRQDEQPANEDPSSHGQSNEQDSKPLISSFETELAKLMCETSSGDPAERDPSSNVSQNSDQRPTQAPSSGEGNSLQASTMAGEALAQTLHSLLSGLGNVTAELKDRLPVLERRLADLQDDIPVRVESSVNHALHGLTDGVQSLAGVMQDTVTAVSHAAESTRRGVILAPPEVDSLRNLAHDIGEAARTLFAPFKQGTAAHPAEAPAVSEQLSSTEAANSEPEGGIPVQVSSDTNNEAQYPLQQVNIPEAALDVTASASKTTLFVGNLSPDVTDKILLDAFVAQGFVGKVSLPTNSAAGGHAGFGYIQFPSTYAASGAIQALQGTYINGSAVNLEFSHAPVSEDAVAPAELPPSASPQPDEARYELQGAQAQPVRRSSTRLRTLLRTYLDMDSASTSPAAAASGSGNGSDNVDVAGVDTESNKGTGASPDATEKARIRRQVEVLIIRYRLQKHFLSRNQAPKESDMEAMSNFMKKLESFDDLDESIIRGTGVHKVLKGIIKLESIPREEEFEFHSRALKLLRKWRQAGIYNRNSDAEIPVDTVSDPTNKEVASDEPSAPEVPPKESLDENDASVPPEEDHAETVFNVRYPPVPVQLPLSEHIPPVNPERTPTPPLSTAPPHSSPLQTGGRDSDTPALANVLFGPHFRPAVPRVGSDSLPGSWPEEIELGDRVTAHEDTNPSDSPAPPPTRRATVLGPARRSFPPSWSLNTDGPARPTGQFIRRSATERRRRRHNIFSGDIANRTVPENLPAHFANTPGSFPVDNHSSPSLPFNAEPEHRDEMDLNDKVDICVGHLNSLGFANGDTVRLRIYAEAACGDLGGAIEMIEEERRALEARHHY